MYYTPYKVNAMKNDIFFVATIALYLGGAIYLIGWDGLVQMIVDFFR